jgi:hypothetical protein
MQVSQFSSYFDFFIILFSLLPHTPHLNNIFCVSGIMNVTNLWTLFLKESLILGICCLRMPLEDFVSNFSELIICRLFNTNIFAISRTWCEMVMKGEWSVGAKDTSQDRSGGGPIFIDTYLRNPQVHKYFLLHYFLPILYLLRNYNWAAK